MKQTIALLLPLSLVLVVCAQIPIGKFNPYRDAFLTARSASDPVLVEHGKTEKSQSERDAKLQPMEAKKPEPFPDNFDPEEEIDNARKKSSIEERLAAWDVISRYNVTLLALAEEQSAKHLSDSIAALGKSI